MGGGTGCPVGVGRGQFVTRRPSYVDRAVLYEYLYTAGADFATLQVVTDGSPPDVVFEGNSREVIRSFPKDIRSELGADLDRVQNGEKPLDSMLTKKGNTAIAIAKNFLALVTSLEYSQ